MDLNSRNRSDLKSYFVKNAIPTESNFAELIDGMLNQRDDGIVKLPGDPLSIKADSDSALQKVINFYGSADPKPAWTLQLSPRTDPAQPDTAKPGLCLSDAAGNNRLFIDAGNGNLGIGTITPRARLEVRADDHQLSLSNAGSKIDWGLTNWTDSKLYIQCWQDGAFKQNRLMLGETEGLSIDQGSTNETALTLRSNGDGWGSGLRLVNTAASGATYGMYSSRDGNLYLDRFSANDAHNIFSITRDAVSVTAGSLVIQTSTGTWAFQSDGNLCFTHRNGRSKWCLNGLDSKFEDTRRGK